MLLYFADGRIRLNEQPYCNTRTNWEFYAVIDGRCALVLEQETPTFRTDTLWVFPPECSHAWTDDGQHPYHRISWHFATVPYPLDEVARRRGYLVKALTAAEVEQLRWIAAELRPHYLRPVATSTIHFQGRLMDLAKLALTDSQADEAPALPRLACLKVEEALGWYAENLARAPTLKEVASAVHVSPGHLRRLFWMVRRTSPRHAFQRARLDCAKELMSRTTLRIDEVARLCGFTHASHLHREFRRFHPFTPNHWRTRLIASFSQPLPAGTVPQRQFSARADERLTKA